MKYCKFCDTEKPKNRDFWCEVKKGTGKLKNICRECENAKHRKPKPKVREGFKICSECKKELPATLEYFRKQNNSKSGLRSNCRGCERISSRNREREKRKDDKLRQKIYESNNRSYKKHREERCRKSLEYHYNHREDVLKRQREYNKLNKERIKKKATEWRQNNILKYRMYGQRRDAKKRELPRTLTFQQWKIIKLKFENRCAYCGSDKLIQQEHFIPLSKGGEYTHNNIIPACRSCNASKNNSDFFEWYPKQEFYSKEREQFILKHLDYKEDKQQLKLI